VLFRRRREPLHQQLAREGELLPVEWQSAYELGHPPLIPEAGIHGIARLREWDAVVTVEAAEVRGKEARFVALPDGTVLIEEAEAEDVAPLADAVERALKPPYRAHASRRSESIWAVGARRIEVVALEEEPGGDELTLTMNGTHQELVVDGARTSGSLPSLEQWAAERFDSYHLSAERLDGKLWEVRAAPL
jgi:hypothetical protein